MPTNATIDEKIITITDGVMTIRWRSRNQFSWKMMLDQVKALEGRVYNTTEKHWNAPATPGNIQALKDCGWEVPDGEEVLAPEEHYKDIELPEFDTRAILRDYQLQALQFLKWRDGRGLIGLPMGAGKTAVTCTWLKINPEIRPALIVCPSSTKLQWKREWRRWVGDDPISVLRGRTPYALEAGRSYIINWDILTSPRDEHGEAVHAWKDALEAHGFKIIIGDEIQAIGNPKAKRTKAFKVLARDIPQFVGMSGTPIRSRPAQFYPILNLLNPRVFNNQWYYMHRYCDARRTPFGWTFNGASNLEELHRVVAPVLLRREKEDILKDLPEKNKIIVPMELEDGGRAYEDQLQVLETQECGTALDARAAIDQLKYSAFAVKKNAALQWIRDFIDGGEKLVVFAYHRSVVQFLRDAFPGQCVVVDGSTTGDARAANIEKFIQDPKIQLFIGNIIAAGVGIDGLQNVCSNAAFVEYPWAPSDVAQAEDRLHRIGQKSSVNIYYLVAPDTIEDEIIKALDAKTKVISKLIKGQEAQEQDLLGAMIEKYIGKRK